MGVDTASALANAATRTAIDGSSFGDNLRAAIPDVIGQAIGGALVGGIGGGARERLRENAEALAEARSNAPTQSGVRLAAFDDGTRIDGGFVGTVEGGGSADADGGDISLLLGAPAGDVLKNIPDELLSSSIWGDVTNGAAANGTSIWSALAAPLGELKSYYVDGYSAAYDRRLDGVSALLDAAAANSKQTLDLIGFERAGNNLETAGLLAAAGIEYAFSPLTAPIDAWFGRGLNSVSGGRISTEALSDAALTVGSFFLGAPEAGAFRGSLRTSAAFLPAEGAPLSIEAQFQANSLRLANEGHSIFTQGVATGDIVLKPNLSFDIQRGSFVDEFIRKGNITLRDELSLDASTIRINQRLYAPDGKYSVPDIFFPRSGNSIDYSYQLKTATTPQIFRIQQASPNGIITIIPPAAVRPVYTIGN